MFLFGLVEFNSAESQLRRAMGQSPRDIVAFLIVVGAAAVIMGAINGFKTSAGDRQNFQHTNTSTYPTDATGRANVDSRGQGDTIQQIERLVALKERGALTDAEFQQEKAKLLR